MGSPPRPAPAQHLIQQQAWTRIDAANGLLICLAALAAIAPFWRPGISSEHDMLMGIYRVFELVRGLDYGIPYSRIGIDLNFTYGSPLFQFYPPLASYGALLWHWLGLGWIESAKAMFSLSLLLAGLGSYVYARWLFGSRRAALVSGLAYLLAPYVLTVIYERGAAAESLALGLVPWLFWALHRILEDEGRRFVWIGSLLAGLLILAHNITALFVLPALALYLILLAWREGRLARLVPAGAAVALGLGLSAFYWLPALAEMRFAQVQASMLGGQLSPLANLAPLDKLVQPTLAADFWGAGRFQLALWQAVLGGLAMLALAVQTPRLRFTMALFAGMLLAALLLQTSLSRPFWQAAPLAEYIQFPWRLLGLASFCVAMLLGSVFLWRPLAGTLGGILAIALLVLIFVLGTLRLKPDQSPIWYQIDNTQIGLADLFERGYARFSLFSDYAPATQEVASWDLARPRPAGSPLSQPLPASSQVQMLADGPLALTLQVESDTAFPLRVHRIYFPGWRASIDGRPAPVEPTVPLGLVTVQVPVGSHQVELRFAGTPLRQLATAISILSWAVLVIGAFRSDRKKAAVLAVIALLVLLPGLVAVGNQLGGQALHRPQPYPVKFQGGIELLGYDLPETTWQPGDVIPLRLVWLARETPASDYRVFVHVARLDDTGQVAQADSLPVLGYSPPTRWEPGEIVVDEHHVELGADVAPGRYQLLAGLYTPDPPQNVPVLQAPAVLPGDRVILGEIEIQGDK